MIFELKKIHFTNFIKVLKGISVNPGEFLENFRDTVTQANVSLSFHLVKSEHIFYHIRDGDFYAPRKQLFTC